ncbi:MAG: hypothetical protein WCY29_00665 [Novosphingobium sp.]
MQKFVITLAAAAGFAAIPAHAQPVTPESTESPAPAPTPTPAPEPIPTPDS